MTLNLTSDLVSRNCIASGAYLLFFEIGISNSMCKCILGMSECHIPFLGHFDLDLLCDHTNDELVKISLTRVT